MKKIIISVFIMLSSSACSSSREVVIGGIEPLTGGASVYGNVLREAAQLRIEQWNAKGGARGYPVRIVWKDGACDFEKAAEVATELIKIDKVKFIIGGYCSGETLGAATVTEPEKVLLLSPMSSSPRITGIGDFVFRTAVSDINQGLVLANKAAEMNYKKIGVLIEDTDYTRGVLDAFDDYYQDEVIVSFSPFNELRNFTEKIEKMRAQQIDALFVVTQSYEIAGNIFESIADTAWEGGILLDETSMEAVTENEGSLDVIKRIFEISRDISGTQYLMSFGTPTFEQFKQDYEKRYNKKLIRSQNSAAAAIDAVDVLFGAFNLAEDIEDTEEIRDILYNTQHVGVSGGIAFDSNGDIRNKYSLLTFDGEVLVPMKK